MGYDYIVNAGPAVASVLINDPLPNGDSEFTLNLPGFGSFALNVGETFDLTTFLPGGFTEFSITGIDTTEMLDPDDPMAFVTGLTFVGVTEAEIDFTMIPQVEDIPGGVPLPSSVLLLLIGLSVLARGRSRSACQ